MFRRSYILYATLALGYAFDCFSMTYDNQFFPLGARPYTRKNEYYSNVIPELFGVMSDGGVGREGGHMPLYAAIFGDYDLNNVAMGLQATGKPNPLKTEWQGSTIPWKMSGKLEGIGGDLYINQSLTKNLSCGASLLVMNVKTSVDFRLEQGNIGFKIAGPGDLLELDRDRLQASEELGLSGYVSNQTGLGDLDTYFRFGNMWHYPDKFRRIDLGLRIGVLFPTGNRRNINNPASIPFAGNGRWGLYTALDTEFELKEDIKVGFSARLIGRFGRIGTYRVPVGMEPVNFGAVVGTFRSNSQLTLVAFPYFLWEDIRDGLGVAASYLCVAQFAEKWVDLRPDKSVPVNLNMMRALSTWTAEYVSVNILYDFSRRISQQEFAPTVSLYWDVPVHFLGEKKVSRTNRVTLGVEFNY